MFTEAHGLAQPMAVALASDGRIFLGEKRGMIRVGHAGQAPPLGTFADLTDEVHNYFDRGLMSIALHPQFPESPYLYVLYTHDPAGMWGDDCPTPPGALQDGCVVNGRLSRLEVAPDGSFAGVELVLVEGSWCQQYPSHSLGDVVFREDGALCMSAGDGASFSVADYGQGGGSAGSPVPRNPCGDPPVGAGGTQTLPEAEGGALRSQDARTWGDPVSYDGAVVCIDPLTGGAWPSNPPPTGAGAGEDRLVAHGLRNPFRMSARPGTNELWVADVGWFGWEELDRIDDTGRLFNFGWPCFEGPARHPLFDALDLVLCETLYADLANPARGPYFAYARGDLVASEPFDCSVAAGASITGLAFYAGTLYPERFRDALFFADYSRDCLWVMRPGSDGLPDPAAIETFGDNMSGREAGAGGPVDLELGPDGRLYLVYIAPGRLARIEPNDSPVAVIRPQGATAGSLPLSVGFDGSLSYDPDSASPLAYSWDLDGDGDHDDSAEAVPTYTYAVAGMHTVGLRVSDADGGSGEASLIVVAGNSPPQAAIIEPLPSLRWRVGQTIVFRGGGTDAEDGPLPPGSLSWQVAVLHCPGNCHRHVVVEHAGAEGSFVALDHEYPSSLEICLSVTDAGFPAASGADGGELSATSCVVLEPETVDLTFQTVPPGLVLSMNGATEATPFTRTVIAGSSNTLSAVSPQALEGASWSWRCWFHGAERSHDLQAPVVPATYTALYSNLERQRSGRGLCRDGGRPRPFVPPAH